MWDLQVQAALRTSIRKVLDEFVANPFFYLREFDPQARLLHEIRSGLSPADVPATLKPHLGHRRHQLPERVRTSRAHAEMKLKGDRLDLVVFRSEPEVELSVYPAGALDVVARILRPEDLTAVVEVKAAPSATQEDTFEDDLLKLAKITAAVPSCLGFFVLFDKSLPLGGATSQTQPRFKWLDVLAEDPLGRIEVHWVDSSHSPCSKLGTVRPAP